MGEITLAKMGGTSHLPKGKAGRKSIKEPTIPGIFNVTDQRCWVLGFKGPDTVYPYNNYDPTLRGIVSKKRK